MLASGRGALVNVASTSAYQATPDMAVYGAGKAFVLSFTEAIAYETRRNNVKVLAVSPGPMRTEFFDKLGTTRPGVGQWQTADDVAEFTLRTLDRRHYTTQRDLLRAQRRANRRCPIRPPSPYPGPHGPSSRSLK